MNSLQTMSEQELNALIDRLTLHAVRKLRRLGPWGARYENGRAGPKGFDPGDFVNAAIEAHLDGRRKWNQQANPTLEEHFQDTIDSQISNLRRSPDHRKRRAMSAIGDDDERDIGREDPHAVNPANSVADEEFSEQFREAAYAAVKDDPVAVEVLKHLQEGWSRKETIELLDMAPEDFDAARKRMNRKIEQKCKRFFTEMTQ